MADNLTLTHPYNRRRVLTIDDLPDDDLLEIFDFCVVRYQYLDFRHNHWYGFGIKLKIESWLSLVHVCRRWRGLVFGSPRRLNVQICYHAPRRSAWKPLDLWPALPLFILAVVYKETVDGVITALEHRDRIRQIDLFIDRSSSQFENLWTAMQAPFPELTVLHLGRLGYGQVLPDSFLGGSAPHLRYFGLNSVPFPELPKLLLSATHLVDLHLHNIPQTGYISPEAMATCLSMLTSLETLCVEFGSPQTYPDLKSRHPCPPTRSVLLPSLTKFSFKGANEYLEEFVARIGAPQLYRLSTTFSNDAVFKTPELIEFISRVPTLGAYDDAYLVFGGDRTLFRLCPFQSELSGGRMVQVRISCDASDRQLSTLAQVCTLPLRLLLTVENLYIDDMGSPPLGWMDDLENINLKWLDILRLFTAVKNLYLSKQLSPRIARVLQELTGGGITEVLPALQNVFLEGFQPSKPVQEGIAQFIAERQLANRPVAISVWSKKDTWDYAYASA